MEDEEIFRDPVGEVRHTPLEHIILQTKVTVAAARGYDSYLCPCRNCHGGRRYHIDRIQQHLRYYGRDYYLDHSMVGGDPPGGFPPEGVWVDETGQVLHGWNE
jgi:hypothetical protein